MEGEQQDDQQQDQVQQPSGRASKQHQQAQARQNTIEKKAQRGQQHLTFVAHDKAVLEQLPAFVRQQLPFVATARGAIDVQLLTMLKLFATAGVGFAAMVKVLKELQNTQYYQRMLVYYDCAAHLASASKPAGEVPPLPDSDNSQANNHANISGCSAANNVCISAMVAL